MLSKIEKEFSFAGFSWPKYVWTLPRGSLAKRREKAKEPRIVGPYYHAPKPNTRNDGAIGFYLNDAGQPFARWLYADDVRGAHIDHNGWYCDGHQHQTMRGIVAQLPHGRFMAGWTMGEGMSSAIFPEVYDDVIEAARIADEHARVAAEREREYQEAEEARLLAEEEAEAARLEEERAREFDLIVDDAE